MHGSGDVIPVITIHEQRLPGTGFYSLWGTPAILLVFYTSLTTVCATSLRHCRSAPRHNGFAAAGDILAEKKFHISSMERDVAPDM